MAGVTFTADRQHGANRVHADSRASKRKKAGVAHRPVDPESETHTFRF